MDTARVLVDYDRCSYCGACVAVCPPDCITLHDATLIIHADLCTLCRRCIPACPTGALSIREPLLLSQLAPLAEVTQ